MQSTATTQRNYDIRYVESDADFDKVTQLWDSHPEVMRTPTQNLNPRIGKVVAAFQDAKLYATLSYHEWSDLPYYLIGGLFIKKGLLNRYDFTLPNNPVPSMLDYILTDMESEKFYTWYYVRMLSKAYDKIQNNGHDLLSQTVMGTRYERFIQEIVPAGSKASCESYNKLISNRTWNKDIMIVQCNLANKYRAWGDMFNDS